MIRQLVLAIVVAVAVTLGCYLAGLVLVALKVDVAVTVGTFLQHYGSVVGVLAGIWYFFAGGSWTPWRRTP
jgi:uncharacterized membrane protein